MTTLTVRPEIKGLGEPKMKEGSAGIASLCSPSGQPSAGYLRSASVPARIETNGGGAPKHPKADKSARAPLASFIGCSRQEEADRSVRAPLQQALPARLEGQRPSVSQPRVACAAGYPGSNRPSPPFSEGTRKGFRRGDANTHHPLTSAAAH